jgi:ribosomal protein S18 acetylase RimI-like enzyme
MLRVRGRVPTQIPTASCGKHGVGFLTPATASCHDVGHPAQVSELRPATAQDADGCVAVLAQLSEYFTPDTHDEVRNAAGRGEVWVTVEDSVVVGFTVTQRRFPGTAEITFAAVAPGRQRTGLGTALVTRILDVLAADGVGMVEVKALDATAGYEPYQGTRQFWQHLGFVQVDRIDPLPGWKPGNPAAILVLALPGVAASAENGTVVRHYEPADEHSWLRCRVLSFLNSDYYDDVVTAKPAYPGGLELVAVAAGDIVGIYDVSVDGAHAVLETLAVHPDHERQGTATLLHHHAVAELQRRSVASMEAWTRDDAAGNAWYEKTGFVEGYRYLHVYARGETESRAAVEGRRGLAPMKVFLHAEADHDPDHVKQFERVYSCRRYDLAIDPLSP